MKQCGFCELKKVCESKLGQSGLPPCAANTGGTQPASVQQLKAEIAALTNKLESCADTVNDIMFDEIITRMRQLSAV